MARLSMKKINKKVAAKKSVRRSKTAKGGKRGKSKRTINKSKTTKQKGGWQYEDVCPNPKCKANLIGNYMSADTDFKEYHCNDGAGQKCPVCREEWCL